jgi:nucleotide-binding universal stress UspA family protein
MRRKRILLVTDRTATHMDVTAALSARAAEALTSVTVLVPAIPPPGRWTWDEAAARSDARRQMRRASETLCRAGLTVASVLGDFSPMESIRDEVRRRTYDEIVVATRSGRVSRWLRIDLPARAAREFSIPVEHVQPAIDPGDLGLRPRRASAA